MEINPEDFEDGSIEKLQPYVDIFKDHMINPYIRNEIDGPCICDVCRVTSVWMVSWLMG